MSKRVLIILTTSFVLVVVVFLTFPHIAATGIGLYVKFSISEEKQPALNSIPIKREVINEKFDNYSQFFTVGEIQFSLPHDSEGILLKEGKEAVITASWGDKGIFISYLGNDVMVNEFKKSEGFQKQEGSFEELLGPDNLQSDFHNLKNIFNTTPADITFFGSRKEKIGKSINLALKSILIPYEVKTIYEFDTTIVKGFQFGNPASSSSTFIEFFDNSNNRFSLITKNLTQKEIDFILSSVR